MAGEPHGELRDLGLNFIITTICRTVNQAQSLIYKLYPSHRAEPFYLYLPISGQERMLK